MEPTSVSLSKYHCDVLVLTSEIIARTHGHQYCSPHTHSLLICGCSVGWYYCADGLVCGRAGSHLFSSLYSSALTTRLETLPRRLLERGWSTIKQVDSHILTLLLQPGNNLYGCLKQVGVGSADLSFHVLKRGFHRCTSSSLLIGMHPPTLVLMEPPPFSHCPHWL